MFSHSHFLNLCMNASDHVKIQNGNFTHCATAPQFLVYLASNTNPASKIPWILAGHQPGSQSCWWIRDFFHADIHNDANQRSLQLSLAFLSRYLLAPLQIAPAYIIPHRLTHLFIHRERMFPRVYKWPEDNEHLSSLTLPFWRYNWQRSPSLAFHSFLLRYCSLLDYSLTLKIWPNILCSLHVPF